MGSDIQPLQSTVLLNHVAAREPEEQRAAVKAAWSRHWITRGFGALEQELVTTSGGVFAVGDALSLADLFVPPQVFNARAAGVDMRAFPTVARGAAAVEALPKLRATTADDDADPPAAMSTPQPPPPAPSAPHAHAHDSPAVLYSYWRSSCSWRVRLALEWKRVAYDVKPVHLLQSGGEHFLEQYTKLNPNQRLPTLVIDGHVLSQSGAILEYLEETRPEHPLLPTDAYKRALVRNVCGIIGADIQPIQNLAVLSKVTEAVVAEEKGAKKVEWAHYWIDRGFAALEQELTLTAGKFCVGDAVTLADIYLVPQVYNAQRFNVDMSKFPTIARVAAELDTVAVLEKAHPSHQVDAQ